MCDWLPLKCTILSFSFNCTNFIFRLFPKVGLIVELAHPSNMRFMKFDVSPVDDKIRRKEILRETVQVSIQVILARTLTCVQGDIRCKVLAALSTVK